VGVESDIMGININFRRWHPHSDHPEWDSLRYGGDKEFPDFCRDLPQINHPDIKEMSDYYDEYPFRPDDFKLWRMAIRKSKLPFRARFLKLMSLCEQNPDYWISFIY